MVDIAGLVNYDQTFEVVIKRVDTGEPLGITFRVVSSDSERVVSALRRLEADRWKSSANGEELDFADYVARQERERLIAAIDGWDWGGNGFGKLGNDPECNEENKRFIITHPNAKWIRDQVAVAVAKIENFTKTQLTPAPDTSA